MIPRKIHLDKPAVMIELKWDKSAEGAIQQIKNKEYIETGIIIFITFAAIPDV